MTKTIDISNDNQDKASIVQWIGETHGQVKEFKNQLRNGVINKYKYEETVIDVTDTATVKKWKKRAISLDGSIINTILMIKTLGITLMQHQEILSNDNSKNNDTNGDSSDSIISSDN